MLCVCRSISSDQPPPHTRAQPHVAALLALKAEFKKATGQEYAAPALAAAAGGKKGGADKAAAPAPQQQKKRGAGAGAGPSAAEAAPAACT